jgi:hypothetical protein
LQDSSGVPRDLIGAAKYCKMSADSGNAVLRFNCGINLTNGSGLMANAFDFGRYFELPADQRELMG